MSFIPLVAEAGVALDALVVEETGSSILGAIASSGVGKLAGSAIESGTKSFVDGLFGSGTFDSLENSIKQTYSSGKTLASDVYNIQEQVESGQFGTEQIEKLQQDRETFNSQPIVQGLSEFSKDLSHLVSTGGYNLLDQSNGIVVNNQSIINNVLSTLAKVNPFYSYLASKFSDKLTDFVIPTNEEYLKVSSIYNGQGIGKMTYDGSRFLVNDETGSEVEWLFPEYNDYTPIPAIFGTWVGIKSPNNSVCLSGVLGSVEVQSYLDKICYMHDCGYLTPDKGGRGLFNEFSDHQLISRAVYGKQNGLFIFPGELATANVAISYFSTLGILMRKMFGPEPMIKEIISETSKVENVEVELIKNDIIDNIRTIPTSYGSTTVGSQNFVLRRLVDDLEISLN